MTVIVNRDKNGCRLEPVFDAVAASTQTISSHYVKQPDGSFKRKYTINTPNFADIT